MNPHYKAAWAAGQHMADSFFARLPSLAVAVIAFLLFYFASILLSRINSSSHSSASAKPGSGRRKVGRCGCCNARSTRRILDCGSVVSGRRSHQGPWNWQCCDRVCISEYPAEFSRWPSAALAEPFRVGDQIKLDSFEGTVEDIQTRATKIKTSDGKRVVIPNVELFTHSVPSMRHSKSDDGNTSFRFAFRRVWQSRNLSSWKR